jgi:hypothetical protein
VEELERICRKTTRCHRWYSIHRFEKLLCILDALEDPIPVTVLDDPVSSAACWILYARFRLKYNDIGYLKEGYDSCEKRIPWIIGDLYGRLGGFNEKRWLFWKERFKTLRDQEDLKQETNKK